MKGSDNFVLLILAWVLYHDKINAGTKKEHSHVSQNILSFMCTSIVCVGNHNYHSII